MASIDGLISGLNTTDMITQIMRLEAAPQTALKNKVLLQGKAVTAYQSINTKMAALLTAAEGLAGADGFGAMKAASGSASVVATASGGAAAGNLTFDVTSLARAQVSTAFVAATGDVTAAGTLSIKIGTADAVAIDVSGDTSAAGVAKAVNDAAIGVKATVVTDSQNRTVLQFSSTASGTANAFTVTGLADPVNTAIAATDAKVAIGDPAAGGYELTSSSNTFNNLLSGVTLTVSKLETGVTLDVTPDSAAIATKAQALVDAANAALSEIATQTKVASGKVPGGPLAGDSTMRKLAQDILSSVGSGAGSLGSFSAVGVQLDRFGTLTFDKEKFATAYAADPAQTKAFFDGHTNVAHAKASNQFDPGWDDASGLARKLQVVSLVATQGVRLPTDPADAPPKQGVIAGIIQRKNDFIGDLTKQVDSWDIRLENRQANLQRQWSALEVAMGKLQSQSSWLSGQLASLPSY